MRPIVPFSRSWVPEKESLRESANEVEVRISCPMEVVSCGEGGGVSAVEVGVGVRGGAGRRGEGRGRGRGRGAERGEEGQRGRGRGRGRGGAYVFQHLDFGGYAFQLGVILVFELGEDGVGVLASVK